MIKITHAKHLHDAVIRVVFSDGLAGDYDLQPLIGRDTEMVRPLAEEAFFKDFFLELGALCWKNGFELSAGGIYERLRAQGRLRKPDAAA